ncbi:MAG: sodium/solute symporter [Pseudomonadota bacterium]
MTWLDWTIVAGYGLSLLLLGRLASRSSNTESEYFLAGRETGRFPVAASTWATKLSALTFIGVPGAAISGNFAYVQLWFGSFLAAYFVATLLIPEFYRLKVPTIYSYLGLRIGPWSQMGGALVFIVSRCLASAVRLAGCAIAVSVFFDMGLIQSIIAISAVAAVYVLVGGLRAVIWTDVLQLALFLIGACTAILFVAIKLPGGFSEIVQTGMAADKFQIFDFSFDIADPATFWTGNIFAFVLGLATGGADQDIAQRALACRNAGQARSALIWAGAADLVSTFLFLSVGVAVFAYYQAMPDSAATALAQENRHDYIFPHFIRHELPAGVRGILVAGLLAAAMSSLDSALSGLSSSAYFDFAKRQSVTAKLNLVWTRILVIAFAITLAVVAIGFGHQPSILWFGLKIMGYTYGGLLGLFLVALFLSRFADDIASVGAVFSSIVIVVVLTQWGVGLGTDPVPWPWAVVIGAASTCLLALFISMLGRHIHQR